MVILFDSKNTASNCFSNGYLQSFAKYHTFRLFFFESRKLFQFILCPISFCDVFQRRNKFFVQTVIIYFYYIIPHTKRSIKCRETTTYFLETNNIATRGYVRQIGREIIIDFIEKKLYKIKVSASLVTYHFTFNIALRRLLWLCNLVKATPQKACNSLQQFIF